ncbi:MAG: HEAT repeat domain-containing protein [Deltaproteobacteria bacterium]|nr:MAG: HEAT repeat domain-containing protein [Deltaproteobacteria bacterium]
MMKRRLLVILSLVGFLFLCTGCQATSNALRSATSNPSSQPSMMGGVSALIKMLGGDADAKTKAKSQLLKMGASAVPALVKALTGSDKATKLGALDVLGSMGPKASSAKAEVGKLRSSSDSTISTAAKAAWNRISGGPTSNPS